jgi:2-phospho-L-lactate guanylyltransferase
MMRVAAVVPVKAFARGKRRLEAVLSASERADLGRAMLDDVLAAIMAAEQVALTFVVTDDGALPASLPASVTPLVVSESTGLNEAVTVGAAEARIAGADALLVVPADLPQLQPATLRKAIAALAAPRSLAIVRAVADGGTNLLGVRPVDAISPAFGVDSFRRHVDAAAAAGIAATIIDDTEIARDLDRPDDLAWFMGLATPGRSHALLTRIGIASALEAS